MSFTDETLGALKASYPGASASLRHTLAGDPLFDIEALVGLARALPREQVEYSAGDLPISQDPDKTPMNGLSPEDTVKRIAENKSWIVLKNIERDDAYKAVMDSALGAIAAIAGAATGAMHKREGFVFVSSPGSVTPFHMDPEHNILMQLSGAKTFHLFPADEAAIVSPEDHEAFHREGGHRNLPYKDEYTKCARAFELTPGDALYVPVKSPHWVKVGSEVSVSLSVTWRSQASDDEARLRRANGWLRSRGGVPPTPGASPMRDRAVVFAERVGARLGFSAF